MVEVFLRSIAGHRVGIGVVSLGLFLISLVIVYTFDAFGGMEAFEGLFESLPESLKALFRAQGGFAANANGYLAADYRHPIYLIAVLAFVISVAVGAVAREVERGSALLVLSAPIARWRYLLAKAGGDAPRHVGHPRRDDGRHLGGGHHHRHPRTRSTWSCSCACRRTRWRLALAVGGIALVVSSRGSDAGQATGIATGIIATMYFIDFLSLIWSPAGPLGPFTVFHYYDPLRVSQETGLPWRNVLVLGSGRGSRPRRGPRDLPAARYRPLMGGEWAGMHRNDAGRPLVDGRGVRANGGRRFVQSGSLCSIV